MVKLKVVHYMQQEKGANTNEYIQLNSVGGDDARLLGEFTTAFMFREPEQIKGKAKTTYNVTLHVGEERFVSRLHLVQGLATSTIMTDEFGQLVSHLSAAGWVPDGDAQVNRDDHGWGNVYTEKILTLHLSDENSIIKPEFPPALLQKLRQQAETVRAKLLEREKTLIASWQRIVILHQAAWSNENQWLHENLSVMGFDSEFTKQTLCDGSDHVASTIEIIHDGPVKKAILFDTVLGDVWQVPVPEHQPDVDNAHIFLEARQSLVERFKSYGFVLKNTQNTGKNKNFNLSVTLVRPEAE